jgi:magnesium transporter
MYQIAAYNHASSEVKNISSLFEVSEYIAKYAVVWLDITAPTPKDIEDLGAIFGFHRLALEDCFHTTQRAKVDNYGDHFFAILKAATYDKTASAYQISAFVGKNYIVTVREKDDPSVLNAIFENIRLKTPGTVKNGTDYLFYLLIDKVVDDYLPIFDTIDDKIEDLESGILGEKSDSGNHMQKIFSLKKEILVLRKAIFPTIEMVTCLQRGDLPNINKKTAIYFNDVYDHIVEVIDLLETSRELISGALDIHMSKTQNTINEVAKMFAVFAIILMWPSVIGAIYGMNFDLPEAQLFGKNAYFVALGMMIVMMVVSWAFFKAKRWI